jgi:hypothetical protein
MSAIGILTNPNQEIPEGSHHYYDCTLEDQGTAIQFAAITAIEGWLDDAVSGTVINSRTAVNLLNLNDGVLSSGAGGVANFRWNLTDLDAKIVDTTRTVEEHRITLRFTYTRSGLSAGKLTRKVLYRVVNLERITS